MVGCTSTENPKEVKGINTASTAWYTENRLVNSMKPISIYLHIPFCVHRCGYCDFNTYAGLESLIPDYVDALCQEISWTKITLEQPLTVHTIFFGGGTPSLLTPSQFEQIFDSLHTVFAIAPDAEISLEANPGTVSLSYLKALKEIAFNRISLGMQTAHPDELRLLERQHDFIDVIQAVSWARKAGFDNLNLDLIFGSARAIAAILAKQPQIRPILSPRTFVPVCFEYRTWHAFRSLASARYAGFDRSRPGCRDVRVCQPCSRAERLYAVRNLQLG